MEDGLHLITSCPFTAGIWGSLLVCPDSEGHGHSEAFTKLYYTSKDEADGSPQAQSNLLKSCESCRVILPTLWWSPTRPLPPTGSTPCARILAVWCCGMPPRTSSSAPTMDPSTTTRARLSVDLHLCRWPLFTPTSTMARSSLCHGWRLTSGPVRTPGENKRHKLQQECSLVC